MNDPTNQFSSPTYLSSVYNQAMQGLTSPDAIATARQLRSTLAGKGVLSGSAFDAAQQDVYGNYATLADNAVTNAIAAAPDKQINYLQAIIPTLEQAATEEGASQAVKDQYNAAVAQLTGLATGSTGSGTGGAVNYLPEQTQAATAAAVFDQIGSSATQWLNTAKSSASDLAYNVSVMSGNESGMYGFGGSSKDAKAAGDVAIKALGISGINTPQQALERLYAIESDISSKSMGTDLASAQNELAEAQSIYTTLVNFPSGGVNTQGSTGHSNLGGLWTA